MDRLIPTTSGKAGRYGTVRRSVIRSDTRYRLWMGGRTSDTEGWLPGGGGIRKG